MIDFIVFGVLAAVVSTGLSICAGTFPELFAPGEKGQALLRSRARGALFWAPYFLLGVAASQAIMYPLLLLEIEPLFRLDLRWTSSSDNWVALAVGYLVAPFAALAIGDFFYYWMHRCQHAVPLLWRFHSTHHAIAELNAINSYHHAAEAIVRIPFIVIPMSLLATIDAPATLWTLILNRLVTGLIHANTRLTYGPLGALLAEPRYHRIHHSLELRHWNKNFASFVPLWDVLFRTAHLPAKGEFPKTGLANQPETRSLTGYLWPAPLAPQDEKQVA